VLRLTEEMLAPEDHQTTAQAKGQANLLRFLQDKGLIYRDDESLEAGFFMTKVLPGTTPADASGETFKIRSVQERMLAMANLEKLIPGDKFVRLTIQRAVEAGKLVLRTADGRVFDKKGCVTGQPGARRRFSDRLDLSHIRLADDVLVAPTDSKAALEWLREDKTSPSGPGPNPPPPPPPPAGPKVAYDWPTAIELACAYRLVELTLTARTPADARSMVGLAPGLGAESPLLNLSVSGSLKGGGSVTIAIGQVKQTNSLKPLELVEGVHRALAEDGTFKVELVLGYGAEGRKDMSSALETASHEAPENLKILARFAE
jgi:hypothetical protein